MLVNAYYGGGIVYYRVPDPGGIYTDPDPIFEKKTDPDPTTEKKPASGSDPRKKGSGSGSHLILPIKIYLFLFLST